jgi:sRNA-binding carbon storage regulator CsrA
MDLLSLDYNDSIVIEMGKSKVKMTLLINKENPDEFAFGVDAPRSIAINREEIYRKKLEAEKE